MNNQLKIFQQEILLLADKVENEWKIKNFELDSFPQLSREILEAYTPKTIPDIDSFLTELEKIDFPKQTFHNNEFSDLPLTLARKEKFSIDLYVWTHSDTNIHDHHFCGAFKVIKGRSFQVSYTFTKTKELGRDVDEGELKIAHHIDMPLNSTHEIDPGSKFIHHVFHLDKPTFTLCIRTDFFPDNILNSYIYPKYRIGNRPLSATQLKTVKALNLSLACDKFPAVLPYDDSEILVMLYLAITGRLKIDKVLWDKLFMALKDKGFATDFFELLNNQEDRNEKLKSFAQRD